MSNSQEQQGKTKNDTAWEKIFQDYSVLDKLSQYGFFEIDSATINQFRESRLMAKFDHSINRPKIFKDNSLSILPVSRNKYKIGYFDAYCKVSYDSDSKPTCVEPIELETIDYTNLSSETSVLSCAFNTGIIADLLNDVEAKMGEIKYFLIRQLYYPYRLWLNKINKKIVPALITYSNSSSIFSCFIYKFADDANYNSIRLVDKKEYIMTPERITSEDVSEVFESIGRRHR